MTNKTNKLLHLTALLCIAAVAIALVSQHLFDMQPCAWCVLQRLIYICIAICCWSALLMARIKGLQRILIGISALLGASGITAAWYQYTVAAHLFSCDQTFADRFMVATGLDAHLPWLFGIFATCMDAKVQILGLDYAIWSLILFGVTILLSLAALLLSRQQA